MSLDCSWLPARTATENRPPRAAPRPDRHWRPPITCHAPPQWTRDSAPLRGVHRTARQNDGLTDRGGGSDRHFRGPAPKTAHRHRDPGAAGPREPEQVAGLHRRHRNQTRPPGPTAAIKAYKSSEGPRVATCGSLLHIGGCSTRRSPVVGGAGCQCRRKGPRPADDGPGRVAGKPPSERTASGRGWTGMHEGLPFGFPRRGSGGPPSCLRCARAIRRR
jgi:hypothetical protein